MTTSTPSRIAVLASGGGSNLQALLDHFAGAGRSHGAICWVGSNRPGAGALARAAAMGVETAVLAATQDGPALLAQLEGARADLLVLAGYLKLIPAEVVRAFRGRLLNIHPALLPAFGGAGMYGHHIHEAVLAHGNTVTGVTVHFVDEAYDRGPIIAQWPVPVLPGDTPATLGARVLAVEHQLYPLCVAAVAAGAVTLDAGGHVRGQLAVPSASRPDAVRFGIIPDAQPVDTDRDLSAFASELAHFFPR